MTWRCPTCASLNQDSINSCSICGTSVDKTEDGSKVISFIPLSTSALCIECIYVQDVLDGIYCTCSLDNKSAQEQLSRIICDKPARSSSVYNLIRFLHRDDDPKILRILCPSPKLYNKMVSAMLSIFASLGTSYNFSDLNYPLVDLNYWVTSENVWSALVLTIDERNKPILKGEFDLPYTADGIICYEVLKSHRLSTIKLRIEDLMKRGV